MDVSQEILKKSTFMYLGLTIQKYYSDQEFMLMKPDPVLLESECH